jgi:aminoglycoside N3'-acetyltransferase
MNIREPLRRAQHKPAYKASKDARTRGAQANRFEADPRLGLAAFHDSAVRRREGNSIAAGPNRVRRPTDVTESSWNHFMDPCIIPAESKQPGWGTMEKRELSRDEVAEQLRALGVREGGVLLVHTSFRAVRPVEGGPRGLIEAIRAALAPGGTVVMPSWTGDDENVFDPASTPAAADLGVVANTFWRMPGVVRSSHPFAFAASGPRAAEITSDPLPLPPHIPASPIGRVHDLDGQVLLLGVNHDADTTLHLAELLANVPYRQPKHITVMQAGRAVRIDYGENDHCGERFTLADGWLHERGLQSGGRVGHTEARLIRARDIVAVALEHLAGDPLIFLHPASAGCEECNEARASTAR